MYLEDSAQMNLLLQSEEIPPLFSSLKIDISEDKGIVILIEVYPLILPARKASKGILKDRFL